VKKNSDFPEENVAENWLSRFATKSICALVCLTVLDRKTLVIEKLWVVDHQIVISREAPNELVFLLETLLLFNVRL